VRSRDTLSGRAAVRRSVSSYASPSSPRRRSRTGVTEAELKEAGFPENKPIYLNMRLKDGDKNRSIPLGLFIRLFLKQPEAAWLNFTSDLLPQ
jgi:hypothetical protein